MSYVTSTYLLKFCAGCYHRLCVYINFSGQRILATSKIWLQNPFSQYTKLSSEIARLSLSEYWKAYGFCMEEYWGRNCPIISRNQTCPDTRVMGFCGCNTRGAVLWMLLELNPNKNIAAEYSDITVPKARKCLLKRCGQIIFSANGQVRFLTFGYHGFSYAYGCRY